MNHLEHQLLREECGATEPRLCLLSATRIDTGRWWRRSPAWLCVMDDELVLLAVGRRRYFERISIADCRASHYNPATGELVIEPGEALRTNRFKISPAEALRILAVMAPAPSPLNT